jgi:hypothetical protein
MPLRDDPPRHPTHEKENTMNISKKLLIGSFLTALVLAAVSPLSSAYARNGADDPAGHNAGDDRGGKGGGHGKDDPAGHR